MAVETSTEPDDGAAPTSVAIAIQLAVLAAAFVIGRALERIRFQWMGEAGAALLLGLVVGLVLKGAGVGAKLAAAVAFKGGIFFYVLLPTIMFDAGYSLDTRMFIKNVGSLCLYAFVGTTISCFVVGLMMWAFGRWGWCYPMPLLANLTFGALISATDPVTVLAVFQRLNAQPDLYMNVFGESVLNDAVGMVLYNVIASFLDGKDVNAGSVFAGIGMFVGIFLGSAAIGIAIGLLAAFIFRSRYFYSGPIAMYGADSGSTGPQEVQSGSNSTFEVGLAFVFAYGSYLVADVAKCSGIVAVVVNGMVMNMYVRPNLSVEAAHKIETLFKTLGGLFELFVFCYIGTTMFLQDEKYNILGYTALSLFALAVSRAANILPCTALVNLLRPVERHIRPAAQFMLWWSGLRGAMAFALSVEADERFGEYGQVMKTCTFYIIFITVIFNGGTSGYLLRRLKLRAEDTPALILHLHDTLAHMHGFGSDDVAAADGDGANGAKSPGPAGRGRRKGQKGVGAEEEEEEEEQRARRPLRGLRSGSEDGQRSGRGGGSEDGEGDRLAELQRAPVDGKPGARRDSRSGGGWLVRDSAYSGGSGSGLLGTRSGRSLASPSALLERVRSLNDGRLVTKFDEFDRRVSRLLIHPDALREAELTTHASFRAGLAANQHGGLGAVGSALGSHDAPQTLTPPSPAPSTRPHVAPDAAATAVTVRPGAKMASAAPPPTAATGGSGNESVRAGQQAVAGPSGVGSGSPSAAAAESGLATWETAAAGTRLGSEGSTHGSGHVASTVAGPVTNLGSINLRLSGGAGSGSASEGGSRSGR